MVYGSVFQGKAPNVTTTWRIIYAIVGFLAIVSFLFFILWWAQIKVSEGRKIQTIFQRPKSDAKKAETVSTRDV